MTWYTARLIFYTKFKDGIQDKYPIHEKIVLIEATTFDDAREKAFQIGNEKYAGFINKEYSYEGRPATVIFAGASKHYDLVEEEDWLRHTTEASFTFFDVMSKADLTKLTTGNEVTVALHENITKTLYE